MLLNSSEAPGWSLRRQLTAFAVGAAAITTIVGGIAIWGGNMASESIRKVYEERTVPVAKLDTVGRLLERQRAIEGGCGGIRASSWDFVDPTHVGCVSGCPSNQDRSCALRPANAADARAGK